MAGFREFVTGEVLTAANVDDFLAKQAVMKFADAAARDSALGTAVAGGNALREGMVAWLDDDDELIAYDGSAWGSVSSGPEFSTAASDAVAIVFDRDRVITRDAAGTVTFSGSSYTAGKSATVRIVPGGSNRTVNFPADWKFVSFKPTQLTANKTSILSLTSFGTTEANVVCAFAQEL